MWLHFEFTDGSNPYLFKGTPHYLKLWFSRYSFTAGAVENFFTLTELPPLEKPKTYAERKNDIRDFAIFWQSIQNNLSLTYGDFADYQNYFETMGKRYGLIKEFKENGII